MLFPDEYFVNIAEVVRSRANCLRRGVGAVLSKDNHLIATGYNGTSRGVKNCTEGGCTRCFESDKYPKGRDYDLCVCVHAEENTFLQAARYGTPVDGAILYTTLQPCLSCLKAAVNAGISGVVYRDPFLVPLAQLDDYERLVKMMLPFKKYEKPEEADIGIRHKITTQN